MPAAVRRQRSPVPAGPMLHLPRARTHTRGSPPQRLLAPSPAKTQSSVWGWPSGTTARAPQGSQLLPPAQEAGGFDEIFKLHASFRRRTGRGESSVEWEAPRMLPGRVGPGRERGPQVRGAPAKADQPSTSLLRWSSARLLPTAWPWPINAGRGQAPGACVLGG